MVPGLLALAQRFGLVVRGGGVGRSGGHGFLEVGLRLVALVDGLGLLPDFLLRLAVAAARARPAANNPPASVAPKILFRKPS